MGILSNIKTKGLNALMRADVALAPHKNDLCFYGSLVILGVGIVKLCIASSKLPENADNLQGKLNKIAIDADRNKDDVAISEDQANAMTKSAKVECAWSIFKEFAPGATLTVIGVAGICKSRHDLKVSNLMLTSTVAGLQEAFNQYRDRVRAEEGMAMDTHYMYGTRRAYIPQATVDTEGKPIIVEQPISNVIDDIPKDLSLIEIHSNNPYWKDDPGKMITFIKGRFGEARGKYDLTGSVTRNDICDLFAVKRDYTPEALRLGYKKDKAWSDAHNGDSPIQYQIHFVTKDNYTKYIPNTEPYEKMIIIELMNLRDISEVSRFRR